jgi:putative hemolysin
LEDESILLQDVIILAILILVNGFFSSAELAVLSVNPNKIKYRADRGDKKAILIKKTLEHQDNFLSTIQIAITLVGLLLGAYAGQTFADPIISLFVRLGLSPAAAHSASLKSGVVILITILLSYFQLVLGELVPKRLALKKTEFMADLVVGPVNFLAVICKPFVKLLSMSTNAVVRLLGIDPNEDTEQVTEEEIRMMVDAGSEIGNIDENEMEMINNIFEFDDKTAEDVSVHRTDIVAIDIDDDLSEIIPSIWEMKYSRVPVYEDNIDNIIGILHIKDILKYIIDEKIDVNANINIDLRKILRKAYFVPTSKKTDELFAEMKLNKIHIAIVVDEYGGTSGIVTMEDLVEEIMGNIFDEYDDEELPEIRQIDTGTYEIIGTASLDLVEETLETNLPDDEYETLSGFLIGQLGYIPNDNERPEVEFNGVLYKISEVEDKRISKIIACKVA